MACESRRCSLDLAALSSDRDVAVPSGWTEYDERAFWAEIESAAAEARDVASESGIGESEDVVSERSMDQAKDAGKDAGPEGEGDQFVASSSAKKYHRLDCRYALKIKPENRVYLQSADEAREKGYIPCKSCHP